jgi:hypothetical protein
MELRMSKFRRVSDSEKIPQYLSKAFDKNHVEDPYANLKQSSAERRQIIAKNKADYKMSSVDEPQEWERVTKQETAQNFEFPRNERELLANTLGASNRIVRKAEYATDEPLTAREVDGLLKPFTDEAYMNVLLKGSASIWEPDMETIKDAFDESQNENSRVANSEAVELMRKKKHEDWEEEHLSQIRGSKYSTARANSILRTAMEMPSDNLPLGMIDLNDLDAAERQRLQMRENRRNAKAKIQAAGRSREETHSYWEDDLNLEATTMQDYYANNGLDLQID